MCLLDAIAMIVHELSWTMSYFILQLLHVF